MSEFFDIREAREEISRLKATNELLYTTLLAFLAASDLFVKDTGMKHNDAITDAAERARILIEELATKMKASQ